MIICSRCGHIPVGRPLKISRDMIRKLWAVTFLQITIGLFHVLMTKLLSSGLLSEYDITNKRGFFSYFQFVKVFFYVNRHFFVE